MHAGGGSSYWDGCAVEDCLGEAVTSDGRCLQHGNPDRRTEYLESLTNGLVQRLSLRGITVSQPLMDEVRQSPVFRGNKATVPLDFLGADIQARGAFSDYSFDYYVQLAGSTVREQQGFRFERCEFRAGLNGNHCLFEQGGSHTLMNSKFLEDVDFSYLVMERTSSMLIGCNFSKSLTLDGAHITGGFHLESCDIAGSLRVRNAIISILVIENGQIGADFDVTDSQFEALRAVRVSAQSAYQVGPVGVKNDCTLAHSSFHSRVRIEVQASELDLTGAQFLRGGSIFVRDSRITLKQLAAGARLLIQVPRSRVHGDLKFYRYRIRMQITWLLAIWI
jgi:hypothetical protein